jgi:hypothetical protein
VQDAGKNKPQVTASEDDEADDAYIKAVRATTKGKWIALPQ